MWVSQIDWVDVYVLWCFFGRGWVGILCGLDLEDIGLVVWVCAFGFGLGVWGIEESALVVLALGKVEDDGSLCMLWMMRILKVWSNFG